MKKQFSITCPYCGKLNRQNQKYCSSCGKKLPSYNRPGQQLVRQHHRRNNRVTQIILGAFLAVIIIVLSLQHNQPLLRTSDLSLVPYHAVFLNRQHHRVMDRYLWMDKVKRRKEYAEGTLLINRHANKKKASHVHFTDSRARYSFVIDSRPKITFYYPNRHGKFNDHGRCRVSGHLEIVYFRMIKLDNGDN